jgi:hypothetical protein
MAVSLFSHIHLPAGVLNAEYYSSITQMLQAEIRFSGQLFVEVVRTKVTYCICSCYSNHDKGFLGPMRRMQFKPHVNDIRGA